MSKSQVGIAIACLTMCATPVSAQSLKPPADKNFEIRFAKIPMRDGVKLFTIILKPKSTKALLPFILERTPYNANSDLEVLRAQIKFPELQKEGYIFVFQDIRGRNQSQGNFVMIRPPCVVKTAKCLDEATDTYDTIKWLLKNVSRNNGRVGQLGISYPAWLTNASAFNLHPALKTLSPQATMGDLWMGDDSFHQGAFRLSAELEYVGLVESSRDLSKYPIPSQDDMYKWYLSFPSASSVGDAVGANAWPSWRRSLEHPTYDQEWQSRSIPRLLHRAPVPTLNVGGFWDSEDMYGPQATYAAMEKNDRAQHNFLILGPWSHGQWTTGDGESLGAVQFGSATGEYYRKIEARWFAYWLKGKGDGKFAEATVFDAGAQKWKEFDAWPPPAATTKKLFLRSNGKLSFDPPSASEGFDQYISDPANPVPYQTPPIETIIGSSRWRAWLTDDQRFVQGRGDVLSWQTEPLTNDIVVAGNIRAQLIAATTGEDADWVVKLIDVYPNDVGESSMSDYQLMIAGDIMRGRYRYSWQNPSRILANTPTTFNVDLHQQAYTFRKGHRMMVQVQSSWFPLYDRNPQTWVPNIFRARSTDYRAQTHRIYHNMQQSSYVQLQLLDN
jgi:uncharacterized protein